MIIHLIKVGILFISQDGWGAVTWAAYRGHAQIVKHLLVWDANPNEVGQVMKFFCFFHCFTLSEESDDL
jgi:hypothetical protein